MTQAGTPAATTPDDEFESLIEQRKHKPVPFGCFGAAVNILLNTMNAVKRHADAATAALEARVRALEDRPIGVKYTGTYETGQTYSLHEASTHKGSLWICKVPRTKSEPGEDPSAWTLAVKRGRDARDLPKGSR